MFWLLYMLARKTLKLWCFMINLYNHVESHKIDWSISYSAGCLHVLDWLTLLRGKSPMIQEQRKAKDHYIVMVWFMVI